MSVPPTVHASHANTYTHGHSTVPKIPTKKASTTDEKKKVSSIATSHANSSNPSSHSSVQSSARGERDCERDHGASAGVDNLKSSPKTSPRARGPNGEDLRRSSDRSDRSVIAGIAGIGAGSAQGRTSGKSSAAGSEAGSERGVSEKRSSDAAAKAGLSRNDERGEIRVGPGANVKSSERARETGGTVTASDRERASDRDRTSAFSDRERAAGAAGRSEGDREVRVAGPDGSLNSSALDRNGNQLATVGKPGASAASSHRDGISRDARGGSHAYGTTAEGSAGLDRDSTHEPSPSAAGADPATVKKPKKPTKAMSKKKAKLVAEQTTLTTTAATAAELLREKRELEARIAAAEAQSQAAAAHVSRVEEAGRLYVEAEADGKFRQEREDALVKLEEAVYEAQAWDAYLKCNPLPDVTDPVQLNSYVSMFREHDSTNPPHLALGPALEACHTTELVVRELTKRLAASLEEKNTAAIEDTRKYMYLLRELSTAKLTDVTCRFLHRADEYESGTDCAFTQCAATDSISYGLWVHNSSRTERIKRIEFPQMDISIELPQSLQKARTCIRIVRARYDHVSITKGQAIAPAVSRHPSHSAIQSSTSSSSSSTRGDASSKSVLTSLSPSFLLSSEEAFTDPTSLFDFDLRPPPEDARAHFVSLGGVLELHQLLLPAPAKKLKSWVLREMTPLEKQLVIQPYPSEESSEKGGSAAAPLRIRFTLPSYIFLGDREPVFGYWDASAAKGRGEWKQEGVNILSFDPKTRVVSLSVPTIKPIAVIQPRALDFPYRSWSVMPVRPESHGYAEPSADEEDDGHTCRLEVSGSRFSICFEMRGLLCRLVSPSHPFLKRFHEEWTTPGALAAELEEIGIRISPSDADAQYCRKPLKNSLLIQTLHGHLALLTQVFDVTSSSHNVSRTPTACTFRIRLNKHSTLLKQAASKKSVRDWEAQAEEDERLDRPDESYKDFPDALREKSPEDAARDAEEKQRKEDIDSQIRQMEKEEQEAEEAAKRAATAAAEALSRSSSTALKSKASKSSAATSSVSFDDTPAVAPPVGLTPDQRYALGHEWVTVLAELISAPADPSLASSSAAAAVPGTELPTSGRALTAKERATGSIHEGLPQGVLLRFTIIKGDDKEGLCDSNPLPGQESHFSLRRCLLAYFEDKTPHDLMTAMSMARPRNANPSVNGGPTPYHFIPFEPLTLQTQQTVRRAMNIFRPFVFC